MRRNGSVQTIRKVSVRGKHRVTDVIWLKLDPELSGGEANATIHIRLGSARCSINGIPVRGLTHSPILVHPCSHSFFFSAWFKNIHFYSRSITLLQITITLLLKYSQVSFKTFDSSRRIMIYTYFFLIYT